MQDRGDRNGAQALFGLLSYDRAEFIEATRTQQSAWAIAEEWGHPLVALSMADRISRTCRVGFTGARLSADDPSAGDD